MVLEITVLHYRLDKSTLNSEKGQAEEQQTERITVSCICIGKYLFFQLGGTRDWIEQQSILRTQTHAKATSHEFSKYL